MRAANFVHALQPHRYRYSGILERQTNHQGFLLQNNHAGEGCKRRVFDI